MKRLKIGKLFFLSCVLLLAALTLLPTSSHAHTVRPAVVTVNIDNAGGVAISIRLSAEAILAGIDPDYTDTNDSPNAPVYDELRQLDSPAVQSRFASYSTEFLQQVALLADDRPVPLSYAGIDVPPVGDLDLARDSLVTLRGQLPAGAVSLQWKWPPRYGSNVLRIVPANDPQAIISVWLKAGEVNAPYRLNNGPERNRVAVIANYIQVGFAHIVPKGLDHILFVLGLFLLSLHLRPLLWQVSAFTVAHTITLGLTIYGVVSLPVSMVESLIALSIAYVGIENCLAKKLHAWRVLLVFGFGLLHGMGFAGVLTEIGLPESEFLTALISFNVGVELGQLAVISGALLLVGWFRNRPWYRKVIVIPISAAISLIGLYWAWERAFT